MNTSAKLKNLGLSRLSSILIEQHLKTYSVDGEFSVIEMGSTIKLTYESAFKCTVNQITTPEGAIVFMGGEAGAEGTIIIFNSSAMKAEAEAKFEEEKAAMVAKATAEQPKAAAKTIPSSEDNSLAMAIGKGVLYTAGAVAVGVGGWFAWKKWGSNTSV